MSSSRSLFDSFSLSKPDLSAAQMLAAPSLARRLPSFRALIPHRLRRKWRATRIRIRTSAASTSAISTLQTSFDPADTVRLLRQHQWTLYDLQYLLLGVVSLLCLSLTTGPGFLLKTLGAAGLLSITLIPITRQFFFPCLPLFGWLILFFNCKNIPSEYRPHIWVRVLPTLENIFYGANLSNILSKHKHPVLDVLAWLPYGITHFGAPAVCSLIMFIWGPPKYVPAWIRAFGWMNFAGVMIQICFPCSPPWYENLYGLVPANYKIPGSPGGLAAIDKLFGVDMYTTTFTASPQVFGALPSLHSGNATLEVLFMCNLFPKLTPLFIFYAMWLWWSTMYLSHHYAVDLVAGSILAGVAFFISKAKFLPRVQHDKMFRWEYDYVEIGESQDSFLSTTGSGLPFYEEFQPANDSDEWTLGSASFSPRSRSPSAGERSSTEATSIWEGETISGGSDYDRSK